MISSNSDELKYKEMNDKIDSLEKNSIQKNSRIAYVNIQEEKRF